MLLWTRSRSSKSDVLKALEMLEDAISEADRSLELDHLHYVRTNADRELDEVKTIFRRLHVDMSCRWPAWDSIKEQCDHALERAHTILGWCREDQTLGLRATQALACADQFFRALDNGDSQLDERRSTLREAESQFMSGHYGKCAELAESVCVMATRR